MGRASGGVKVQATRRWPYRSVRCFAPVGRKTHSITAFLNFIREDQRIEVFLNSGFICCLKKRLICGPDGLGERETGLSPYHYIKSEYAGWNLEFLLQPSTVRCRSENVRMRCDGRKPRKAGIDALLPESAFVIKYSTLHWCDAELLQQMMASSRTSSNHHTT